MNEKNPISNKKYSWLVMAVFLFLTSCQEVNLLEGLDQRDANEVMVILANNDIKAQLRTVQKQQEVSWAVAVPAGDEQHSRQILFNNHLPRIKELGLSGICKDAGLIPTPKTEKCRELLGYKGEVINSLESIPGVVNADVVINIPDKEEFADADSAPQRPTASVVVQLGHLGANQDAVTEPKIQQFVANAIPGLDMRDVAVIISGSELPKKSEGAVSQQGGNPFGVAQSVPATKPVVQSDYDAEDEMVSVGIFQMDSDSSKKFKVIAVIVVFLFLLVSGGMIALLIRMRGLRQKSMALQPLSSLSEKAGVDDLVNETGGS